MPGTIELDQADPVAGKVAGTVPCIDAEALLGGECSDLVQVVRSACKETGFFFVDLSAAQRDTLAATLAQMQRFFALDDRDSIKRNTRQDERDFGWVPKYTEPAYQPGTVSRLEGFDFGLENVENAEHGIWPPLPDFQADCTRCWHEYIVLGEAILELIARAAGLDAAFLVERCDSHSLGSMRLLCYDGDTRASADEEVGIAAHTDFECITLIYQTAPGLELRHVNGQWLDAPACVGRIVVLLDDMLERWTNGVFKATGHRVRSTAESRFSIVMFFAVNENIEIAPLPQFVSATTPSRYAPITQAEHIDNEIARAKQNAAAMTPELRQGPEPVS